LDLSSLADSNGGIYRHNIEKLIVRNSGGKLTSSQQFSGLVSSIDILCVDGQVFLLTSKVLIVKTNF